MFSWMRVEEVFYSTASSYCVHTEFMNDRADFIEVTQDILVFKVDMRSDRNW